MRAHAHLVHHRLQRRRPIGARRRRRPIGGILIRPHIAHMAKHVGNHAAVEIGLALGGEPTDNMAAALIFAKDFPERAATAGGCGNRYDRAAAGIDLSEARHAVMVGHLAGGNRGPQHRRQLRFERGEVAAHAALHQSRQCRHFSRIHQRMHDLPIGGIPADQEQAFLHVR